MHEERLRRITEQITNDVLHLWQDYQEQGLNFSYVPQGLASLARSNSAPVFSLLLERPRHRDGWVRWRAAEAADTMMRQDVRIFAGQDGQWRGEVLRS